MDLRHETGTTLVCWIAFQSRFHPFHIRSDEVQGSTYDGLQASQSGGVVDFVAQVRGHDVLIKTDPAVVEGNRSTHKVDVLDWGNGHAGVTITHHRSQDLGQTKAGICIAQQCSGVSRIDGDDQVSQTCFGTVDNHGRFLSCEGVGCLPVIDEKKKASIPNTDAEI